MAYITYVEVKRKAATPKCAAYHKSELKVRSKNFKAHRKATDDGYLVIVEVVGAEQRRNLPLITFNLLRQL